MYLATGCRGLGTDIQPALVEKANSTARELGIEAKVSFTVADASECDLSKGTIFYLYNPFQGETMRKMIEDLHALSKTKPIVIFSPCYCSEQERLDRSFERLSRGIYRSRS